MADPDESWALYPLSEFAAYAAPAAQDDRLAFSLLMCLSAQHKFTGAFRFCLFGGGELSVTIPLDEALYPTPPEFSTLTLIIATSPRDIILQQNSAASAWIDVVDMLRDKSALLVNTDDVVEDHTPLVDYLLSPASKKANLGASIRWMVAARPDCLLTLELQLLPVPARMLNKQNLRQDNAVSVLLKSFRIRSTMFSSDDVRGPVPLLFAPDREAAAAALQTDARGVLADIRLLNERILCTEHLSLQEAVAYMQGRHRVAKGYPVFPCTAPPAAPPKRPRIQAPEDSSTGTYL